MEIWCAHQKSTFSVLLGFHLDWPRRMHCAQRPMDWDPHAATCAREMASLISRAEDPYFCKIENRCSAKYSNLRCNIWHLWYMHDACLDLWKLELFVFCLLRNCFFLCDENFKVYPWICTLRVQMVQLSLWLSSWKELRSSRICSWSRFSTCSESHRNWWRPSGPEMKQEEDWYHGHSLICYIASLFADIRCFLFAHSVQSWHSGQAWLSVERVLYLLLHLPLLLIAPAMYLQIATVFAWTENCTTPSKKAPALRAFFFDVHRSHNMDSRILEFKGTTRCKSVMKCTHDRIYHLDRRVMPMDVTSL